MDEAETSALNEAKAFYESQLNSIAQSIRIITCYYESLSRNFPQAYTYSQISLLSQELQTVSAAAAAYLQNLPKNAR